MEQCLGVRKGTWTEEEDELLRACIHQYGQGKWHLVPRRAGLKRCRKSCRLRWLNYLNPEINREDFTESEVDIIFRCHRLLGNRWSLIAGRLPGRTANDVKNYWYSKLRNKEASSKKDKKEEAKESITVKTHVVIKPKPRTFSKNSPWLRRRPMFVDDANVCAREGTSELLANDPAQPCLGEVSQSEDWTEWWKSFLEDKEGDRGKSITDIWDDDPFMEGQSCRGDYSLNVNLWDFP